MLDSREKVAVFIDGANLYASSKAVGFDIDYKKLETFFRSSCYLLRLNYYTALIDAEYSSLRPLTDWLDYNGYRVVTKIAKEFVTADGGRKVKGNMDIELAVDAISIVSQVDHFVLFSGDGDFTYLVDHLQRMGKRVTVISTFSTNPPMISDDLRRKADAFIDLASLQTKIEKSNG